MKRYSYNTTIMQDRMNIIATLLATLSEKVKEVLGGNNP